MSIEMQIALLGILGTLGGTILGWLLNSLSQKGKLYIYVSSWNESFTYNDHGSMTPSTSIEQTECYDYNLSIDLYNSSGETKIMRDINIVFANNNNILYKSIPEDDSTKRVNSYIAYYDEVSPINIQAKSIINIALHDSQWNKDDSLAFIWNTNNVYFTYKNEKNKLKKLLIKKVNYKDYFKNHKVEGCNK